MWNERCVNYNDYVLHYVPSKYTTLIDCTCIYAPTLLHSYVACTCYLRCLYMLPVCYLHCLYIVAYCSYT